MQNEPVEIVPGKLFALGDTVQNDGRITWAPPAGGGHEPIVSYLLLEEGRALLVDAGVAAHEAQIRAQLQRVIGADTELGVFCTRFEPDCLSNLGPILAEFNVVSIFGGGVSNPFDFFDDVSGQEQMREDHAIEIVRKLPGDWMEITPERQVQLVSTNLRVLSTTWLFDERTGALFTSDALGYENLETPGFAGLLRDNGSPEVDIDRAASRLFTKLDWLLEADTTPFLRNFEELFETRDVRIIAPAHGRVAVGPDAVAAYRDTTRRLLSELTSAKAER